MRLFALAVTTLLLSAVAAPAYADDDDKAAGAACWVDADRGTTQCFATVDAMEDAVLAQTGTVLLRLDSAAARPVGVLASFVLAELFTNSSYGGGVTTVTSSSSTACATGSVSGNLSGAANNSTSSYTVT